MKRIPKIPGEVTVSGGTMGPPDVPDNRKNFQRISAQENVPCGVIQNQNYQQ